MFIIVSHHHLTLPHKMSRKCFLNINRFELILPENLLFPHTDFPCILNVVTPNSSLIKSNVFLFLFLFSFSFKFKIIPTPHVHPLLKLHFSIPSSFRVDRCRTHQAAYHSCCHRVCNRYDPVVNQLFYHLVHWVLAAGCCSNSVRAW